MCLRTILLYSLKSRSKETSHCKDVVLYLNTFKYSLQYRKKFRKE